MSSEDYAIRVTNLSKCYQVYSCPQDRLKQSIVPRLRSLLGQDPGCYFREFWALKDVSFEVASGETIGIIGRNGSGKSTLLQMICGTLEPTIGMVETRGRVAALLELGAGFNPEFTGRENVYMNATVLGLTQQEIDAKFDEIVAFADIGNFIEQPVKHYSSGMYARLAFAVAINVDPKILIVDEALSVGDEPFQRKCFSRIEQIKRNGGTILFVSHSAQAIISLCDRVVLLHSGERFFTGPPKKAMGWYQKLMNASPEKSAQLIDEIRRIDTQGAIEDGSALAVQNGDLSKEGNTEEVPEKPLGDGKVTESEESHDASLISKSMIAYESNGAEISHIKLITLEGKEVNQLINSRRYKISYDIDFHEDIENITCFFAIKTVSGLMLGGGRFPLEGGADVLNGRAGASIRLQFEFECALLSGVYFVNCAILKSDGSHAHRVLDALVFRVISLEKTHSSGIVDFHVKTEVKTIELNGEVSMGRFA